MFIKATQGDSTKDSREAASSTDSKAQDSMPKQKETKGGWSDAATFIKFVREGFVVDAHGKKN